MQIQKLGLDIRKIGDVKTFYKDVDTVLQKYSIEHNEINIDVQQQSVAHSLQRMLNVKGYFDVCTVRNCAELCQINIQSDRMRVYSSVHCVDWAEMTSDFRNMLIAMVLDDFRSILSYEQETDYTIIK